MPDRKSADLILRAAQVVTCAGEPGPRKGAAMSGVGLLLDSAIAIVGGCVAAVGPDREILGGWRGPVVEARCLVPGLVDAHTHPLFGGSRVKEYLLRAQGADYQQIHAAGGGIFSTVRATVATGDEELLRTCGERLARMLQHGTTTLEAKSGYGLTTNEELRQLRLLYEAGGRSHQDVVLTFMGAHAVAEDLNENPEGYIELLREEMIPAVARQGLARYADVFCEVGAFTVEQSHQILAACKAAGFALRIHAEEFNYLGGARMAAGLGATTVDHLQCLPESDFGVLREAGVIPVMTAGTSFFLGLEKFAPARGLIDAGLAVALGSDFNAGSCLSESLQTALSLAVLKLRMSPEEALVAATVNSACSLGMGERIGSLEIGKQADMLSIAVDDYREWPYHVGVNLVDGVWKKGVRVC